MLSACPVGITGSVAVRDAWLGDRQVWVQGQGWLDHLCPDIAAYALSLRLNLEAGTAGSTMSCLNCGRWL